MNVVTLLETVYAQVTGIGVKLFFVRLCGREVLGGGVNFEGMTVSRKGEWMAAKRRERKRWRVL